LLVKNVLAVKFILGRVELDGLRYGPAVLVYGRRKHFVNVFVMKPQGTPPTSESGERQGYHWRSWQKDGLEYLAVADAGADDLHELRDLILKE